ncbi:MAG: YCF48-related protein [Pseudomonadota bacterium]
MQQLHSMRRPCAALALAASLGGFAGGSGATVPDMLERPSTISAKASGAVLLAVTRAGDRLLAVGERGIIIYSDDNGAHWSQAGAPVSVSLTGACFASATVGWAVGHSGVVLRSVDGGKTWARQFDGKQAAQRVLAQAQLSGSASSTSAARRMVDDGADKPFLDVLCLSEQRAIVVGAYGLILETVDGGRNWTSLMERIGDARGRHLYSIVALPDKGVLVAGEQGALFRSGDDGRSFAALAAPYEGTYFRAAATGARGLLLLGLRGNAYVSDDAGKSWSKSAIPATNSLTGAVSMSGGQWLVSDESGRLYRSADQGRHFSEVPAVRAAAISDLRGTADGAVVLAGARGVSRISASQIGSN